MDDKQKNANESNTSPSKEKEKFDEVLADEFKLQEWTIWEQYDAIRDTYLTKYKKVAWFNDIISFWQVWNNLPVANLKNFFYDVNNNTVPMYDVKGQLTRISTLGMFISGVKPIWEDPANATGGEYQMRFMLTVDNESSLDKLNNIWGSLVMDLITNRFPHLEKIMGVRIVDKSFPGKEAFRVELWTKFNNETADGAKEIREFIESEYNTKNIQPQSIAHKNHILY